MGAADAVFETIGKAVAKHEEVSIAGFGTTNRPARAAIRRPEKWCRYPPRWPRLSGPTIRDRQCAHGCREQTVARATAADGRPSTRYLRLRGAAELPSSA